MEILILQRYTFKLWVLQGEGILLNKDHSVLKLEYRGKYCIDTGCPVFILEKHLCSLSTCNAASVSATPI